MKTIKLNEEQLRLLSNLNESNAPDFEDGDIKEFGNPSEISSTETVQDDEGNPKYGKMPMADRVSKRMTPQSYWSQATNGRRLTAY